MPTDPPRVLVTVAHPDDETFGCGSVLLEASARGAEVVVACATRGEVGEPAPGCGVDRAELADVREAELRHAAELLGVQRVELLGWRDSGMDGEPDPESLVAASQASVAEVVARLIDDVRPDVVVTLDASDGHRDHAAIRDATLDALELATWTTPRAYLWGLSQSLMARFVAHPGIGTPDEDITTVVDVARHVEARWRAIRAHATQVPPYDLMAPELAHEFLRADHLRRIRPPWSGGPRETSIFG